MPISTDVIALPQTPLCGQQIALPCKGATETRTYVIVCTAIVDVNDSIQNAVAQCTDPLASVRKISFNRDSVNLTLSGGTRNYLSAVELTLTLASGDVRVPILALTTEDQGVLQEGDVNVVVGSTGRRGTMIFTEEGPIPPSPQWTPPAGITLFPDDLLLNTTYHKLYTGTYQADGSIAWTEKADLSDAAAVAADTPIPTETHPDALLGEVADRALALPEGQYSVGAGGLLLSIGASGVLPADVTLNGGVYMAGETALPAGLSADPATGIILTDGSIYYPNTINNVGVLCAATE